MDRNGLKLKNQASKERGKKEFRKNSKNTKNTIHKLNLGGHKVVRAILPAAKMSSYTILSNCGPLPLKKT